ncbi:glutamate synthase central domain-containing protein [Curtobacterium flaccumfaciens]|nr:glutamate synthase central domain-containing protein [Curtobacterium flaccumfaciens]
MLAARRDYGALLDAARVNLDDLPAPAYERTRNTLGYDGDLSLAGRYVAYSLNQESFRFMLDPMLQNGSERISAMGYGNAINALSDTEGGMAKYFSQRFAQVTNPPLDSIPRSRRHVDARRTRRQAGRHRHHGPAARRAVADPGAPGHGAAA